MNKKTVLILSLIASAVLLTSLWVAIVQSRSPRRLRIPTAWYQTVPSLITTEMWNWDWSGHTTVVPWPTEFMLYKRVGDAVFFALHPQGSMVAAYRDGESSTFRFSGGLMAMGGPMMAHLMMFNGTLSITFTDQDIPLTNDDNDYKGLRMLVEIWIDVYGREDIGGDQYVWHGSAHQHVVFWAPKGSRA